MFLERLWRCLIHTAVGTVGYVNVSSLVYGKQSCYMYITARGKCDPGHAMKAWNCSSGHI